jgi:hypothetical protein
MTLRRAVIYIGGASLLVAWFSSAASLTFQRHRPPVAAAPEPQQTENLALHVQAQSKRLKERLAAAPLPQTPARNPFVFGRITVAEPPPRRAAAPAEPVLAEMPAEPALVLIGIAEQRVDGAVVRTAMITTAGDELIMVKVGDPVIQRYTVSAIGANLAELLDVTTGRLRRLTLQDQ